MSQDHVNSLETQTLIYLDKDLQPTVHMPSVVLVPCEHTVIPTTINRRLHELRKYTCLCIVHVFHSIAKHIAVSRCSTSNRINY